MKAVSVTFSGSPREYAYWCADDTVKIGDNAIVDTKRGEATVIVVEVKDRSDRATAQIKRLIRSDAKPDINTLF